MAVKNKYTNITASFGSDLIAGGSVVIPRMLLENYTLLGLNDQELVLILHLLRLRQLENNGYPSVDDLAYPMSLEMGDVRRLLASLMEKGVLKIKTEYSEGDELNQVYSLTPLFEKLSEVWACQKVQTLQKARENLGHNSLNTNSFSTNSQGIKSRTQATFRDKPVSFGVTRLVKSLEQEFGRPLSPIEIEQVKSWVDNDLYGDDIVLEALKRAVLLGKLNFRYIDTILLEWNKRGIRSAVEIKTYEARFKEKQAEKIRNKSQAVPSSKISNKEGNKGSNKENRRKELLELLYMN